MGCMTSGRVCLILCHLTTKWPQFSLDSLPQSLMIVQFSVPSFKSFANYNYTWRKAEDKVGHALQGDYLLIDKLLLWSNLKPVAVRLLVSTPWSSPAPPSYLNAITSGSKKRWRRSYFQSRDPQTSGVTSRRPHPLILNGPWRNCSFESTLS